MKFLLNLAFATLFTLCAAAMPPTALAKTHAKPKSAAAQQDKSAAQTPTAPSVPPPASDAAAASPNLPTANTAPHPGAINVPTPPPPSLSAKSWALMDYATGQVLADSNADARVEPASITK